MGTEDIDVAFDFRSDTPDGKDPDAFSPTLRRYHRLLWSKPLPDGGCFDLTDATPSVYLHHRSEAREFFLASDAVIPTFRKESSLVSVFNELPSGTLESFNTITSTIGGMMVFPANRIDGRMTINGARGFHPRIKDRFDLTVECLRRHYRGGPSPLSEPIQRYRDFFGLFGSFERYVDFFLLEDIVSADYSSVRFFAPFDDFESSPIPATLDAYQSYRQHATEFVVARNKRILQSRVNAR
jgi:hypothetical protein